MTTSSRPSRDEMLMQMAEVASSRATCSRRQVGVVIAHQGRVLSTGYNGAPAGMEHCNHECNCPESGHGSWETYTGGGSPGQHGYWCASLQPCIISVHAEANAIAYAARHGVSLQWSSLYTTCSPCLACAQLIINAGIKEVVYGEDYRTDAGIVLLKTARINLVHLR